MGNFLVATIVGILFSFTVSAEQKLTGHIFEEEKNDLPQIVSNRYFRVLTSRNSFDYHVFQGKPRGYQYELMKAFVRDLNERHVQKGLRIQFELVPVDYDQLLPMLLKGQGDLIAANLTITPQRSEKVAFSKPLREVKELLITRKELVNESPFRKKIALRKSSSYFESVKNYNRSNPEKFFAVEVADEDLTPEAILELVNEGRYDYALIDSHLFDAGKKIFSNLALAKVQPFAEITSQLAIAVRKNSPKLLEAVNRFIPKVKKGSYLGNIIDGKYFNDNLLLKNNFRSSGKLSPYDKLFKKYAKKYGWDWKLLASLCFQESRFKQEIVNKWGAIGLFQIKQATAEEPYVDISNIKGAANVENNIHAGVKYLSWIRDRYFGELPQRRKIRLSLAAYNAGPANVLKARKLAEEMGLDPDIWFRNVELAMMKMRKIEPIDYVSQINKRYVGYKLLFNR